MRARVVAVLCLLLGVAALAPVAPARAATVSRTVTIAMADGTLLAAQLTGAAPLAARPTVVEFTPYGTGGRSYEVSADYNYLLVQIRGTGSSKGTFDALGPQTQADVARSLRWACDQPWSNGSLAVAGFSASAITIFNSLHLRLPCVKAAILRSGTFELYRDLLVPGGITNAVPGLAVLAAIGAPAAMQGDDRISDPASGLDVLVGLLSAGANVGLLHPRLDSWWRQRGFRGNVNRIPTLLLDGVYDVEPRGDYQAFQHFRRQGIATRLLVAGAHDGAPAGTDHGVAQIGRWLDHYVRGVDNGVQAEPAVQMLVPHGDREDYAAGAFTRFNAATWPVPGTRWTPLYLSAATAGVARSVNDGSLSLRRPSSTTVQRYAAVTSQPFAADPNTIATVSGNGLNDLTTYLPFLTDMDLADALGLTYVSPPLRQTATVTGPASLDLTLASTAPTSTIWAVVSDVWPDGSAHPLAVGRLNTDYPRVIASKSLRHNGRIVQPYGDYSHRDPATPNVARRYHVEIWPIVNRFAAGHRIQVSIIGQSALSMPGVPGVNAVTLGGQDAARLMFPTPSGRGLVFGR